MKISQFMVSQYVLCFLMDIVNIAMQVDFRFYSYMMSLISYVNVYMC